MDNGFQYGLSVPSYQVSALTAAGLDYGLRTTPDVSFNAGTSSGVAVFDSVPYDGTSGWFDVGGTSAAAPAWAGLVAITDQGLAASGKGTLSTTQLLTDLYALPSADYHDITSGFNGYSAGDGVRPGHRPGNTHGQSTRAGPPGRQRRRGRHDRDAAIGDEPPGRDLVDRPQRGRGLLILDRHADRRGDERDECLLDSGPGGPSGDDDHIDGGYDLERVVPAGRNGQRGRESFGQRTRPGPGERAILLEPDGKFRLR